jgi:hypothetical protein
MNIRSVKPSSTVLIAVVALVIGLESPAMAHQANVAVHKIRGSELVSNSVTGKQIKESTLGVVPEAKRLPPLKWHVITTFIASDHWVSYGSPYFPAAYALDSQGVVHFRGAIKNTLGMAGSVAFLLPTALQPTHFVNLAFDSQGGVTGDLEINGANVAPNAPAGGVTAVAAYTSLDGVTYSVR